MIKDIAVGCKVQVAPHYRHEKDVIEIVTKITSSGQITTDAGNRYTAKGHEIGGGNFHYKFIRNVLSDEEETKLIKEQEEEDKRKQLIETVRNQLNRINIAYLSIDQLTVLNETLNGIAVG